MKLDVYHKPNNHCNMAISDKAILEYKAIYQKEYGKEITDAEAREQGERLIALFEILYQQSQIEFRRKQRLKKEPDGFLLDPSEGPFSCGICGEYHYGNEMWWNLDGMRCNDCRRNIQEGTIPHLKSRHDDKSNWFESWQIRSNHGVHPSSVRKLTSEGMLNGRDLKRQDGTVYQTVYLIEENQEFLKKYPKKKSDIKKTASGSDGKEILL